MLKFRATSASKSLAGSVLLGTTVLILRFVYVVTVHGQSCTSPDVCFFSSPPRRAGAPLPVDSRRKAVSFYASAFHDLIMDGFLSPGSKSLSFGSPAGHEVAALRRIGVADAIGVGTRASPPMVIAADPLRLPFDDGVFDFVFVGPGTMEVLSMQPRDRARELARLVKEDWFLVVHTVSAKDAYSLNSLLQLFPEFRLVKSNEIQGLDVPALRSIVLQKEEEKNGGNSSSCATGEHKAELVKKTEPLIEEEPLEPWITLRNNMHNIQYLPGMVDIGFKHRYVYVDVGARSYNSSIGSWFREQYPKENRNFEIYAIEADGAFHEEYSAKEDVQLLPLAAWVRNESLVFEVIRNPAYHDGEGPGTGMGRISRGPGLAGYSTSLYTVQGFDFAEWLKSIATEMDYVVIKMDVEGTEFDLIPRLIETGAICLVDEMFLECHYNRWQRCCPGERTPKYKHNYTQCLELFSSLRETGVVVHQWY